MFEVVEHDQGLMLTQGSDEGRRGGAEGLLVCSMMEVSAITT